MYPNKVTTKGRCVLLASLLCCGLPALAISENASAYSISPVVQQDATIKGQVLDHKTGDPVIGANVIVKGTTNGTITDMDGKYELNAPVGATLQISYIGYQTVEVQATAGDQTIQLREDAEALDELVVVGYGVQKKESLTGALQTLKDEKLKDITTPSVENMLNGKVSGVYVAPGSGQPGASGSVVLLLRCG